jgi:hypothetical protein
MPLTVLLDEVLTAGFRLERLVEHLPPPHSDDIDERIYQRLMQEPAFSRYDFDASEEAPEADRFGSSSSQPGRANDGETAARYADTQVTTTFWGLDGWVPSQRPAALANREDSSLTGRRVARSGR